ncbi:unnamed protein product [Phaedon cochleariae]|uniref:Uncharacterized protein n=1 Tax=Phaedon cochleariae TaxID=80249 RepID=A0A9P0DVY4_PHACE|nr:unnamed protein product [Phaedon cochleariae]
MPTRSSQVEEAHLESLISKISSKLLNKIDNKLENMTARFDTIDVTLNSLNAKFIHLEEVEHNHKKQFIFVNEKLDELHQNSKMNSLRLIGVNEETDENLISKILSTINDGMKIKCAIFELNRVFRVGKISADLTKPRAVIVDFVTNLKRNEVYKAKFKLKGTGIFINEDLTEYRYKLLLQAKKRFGNKEVWSQNCKIYAKCDNAVKLIRHEVDLAN